MNGNEQINALLGKKQGNDETGEDYKSKYEEMKRLFDSAKVENGRVKALDTRIKELEKENAMLKGKQGAARIAEQLTPEERGDIPDDYVGVAARLAAGAADNAMAGVNEELQRIRQEREAEKAALARKAAQDFVGQIDRKFPGFLDSIGPGGDKEKPWAAFLVHNAASVQKAMNDCDYKSLVYHIEHFYRETLGVRPPNGASGSAAAPDPVSQSGGSVPVSMVGSGDKVYTPEEYAELDAQCMNLRRQGRFDEYRKLRDELDNILAENRISG